jgi:hypothetical protein
MEIDIEIKKITYNKIRLDDEAIIKVIADYIYNKYNIDKDDVIKDGNLTRDIEYHGSHSWYDIKVLREATDFDVTLLKLLKELK